MQQETMRGSLFPLFPLRVKCQNHERVPISPISPILVANVYSSCQDMDHQNRGNTDPLNALPWWSAKTMRGSLFPLFPLRVKCQNHERVPISPISPMVWWPMSIHPVKDHQNRGNRDPLNVFPWWSAKTMKGSLFPLFWWPMSIHPVKTWTTNIGEIGTLSRFSLDEVPKPWKGPYFPYFGGPGLDKMTRHGPPK